MPSLNRAIALPLLVLILTLIACTEPQPASSSPTASLSPSALSPLTLSYGTVLPAPRPLAAFILTDQHGAAFANANLVGQWTVIFSGFTSCPDICPLTLALLKSAEEQMSGQRHHNVVFITVDPERDSAASLKQFINWFEPRWTALTGADKELSTLLASLGMAQVRLPALEGEKYSIEHSTALVLLDPQGRMAGFWKAPLDPAELAADFSALPAP